MTRRKRKPKKPELPAWMETFRTNLRATRRRLNVSQKELAERTGQFPNGISAIERGMRPGLTFDIALELAEHLGVSLEELMGTATADTPRPTPRPGNAKRIPDETVVVRKPRR